MIFADFKNFHRIMSLDLPANLEPVNILAIGYAGENFADPERHIQTQTESINYRDCIVLVNAHPSEGSKDKNQYPLKSIIPALCRENILADIFICGIALEKLYAPKTPPERGWYFSYAAVKPCATSASVNSSFFSPLSVPFRSMV